LKLYDGEIHVMLKKKVAFRLSLFFQTINLAEI